MPALASRSSSISSASSSTTSKSSSSTDLKKKFCCSFPSCGKSFSRSEHLHRHALNHKEGNNTCVRCSAHFRRRDLLDRHMARHKEKDDEAGGEGLGILATRKRLWRDSAGNIVNARRPSYTSTSTDPTTKRSHRVEKKRPSAPIGDTRSSKMTTRNKALLNALPSPSLSVSAPMARGASADSTIVVDTIQHHSLQPQSQHRHQRYEYPDPDELSNPNNNPKLSHDQEETDQNDWLEMNTLPSPPLSSPSLAHSPTEHDDADHDLSDLDALYEESWPLTNNTITPSWSTPSLHHQQTIHHEPNTLEDRPYETFMGAMAEVPYEDLSMGMGLGGMYEWQQPWSGGGGVLSRCREEKFEVPMVMGGGVDGRRGFLGAV